MLDSNRLANERGPKDETIAQQDQGHTVFAPPKTQRIVRNPGFYSAPPAITNHNSRLSRIYFSVGAITDSPSSVGANSRTVWSASVKRGRLSGVA